ncbi:homologous recombination OB-fold protein [Elgaria multicarinata webbii]|uniref:homologous recombination OB-fold protein n=1 Tax=Elgaria multicarinata webbii TaxID=159646 RepID=UPI002FCD0B1E
MGCLNFYSFVFTSKALLRLRSKRISRDRRGKACGLQQLFSIEAEFEDEDFLLAVKDVEKQALDPTHANIRCLRPLSAVLRAPSSALTPTKDSGTLGHSEAMSPVFQVQNYSRLRCGEDSCPSEVKSKQTSPLVTSFKVQKDQSTFPVVCKSSCSSGTRFKFVNRHPAVLSTGAFPCEEEIDNELALAECIDHEDSGTCSYPMSFRSDSGPQEQMRDNGIEAAKKPRVANSVILTKPVGSETSQLKRTQEEKSTLLQPVEASSKLTLRPTAMGSYFSQSNIGVSSDIGALSNSSCQMLKSLQTSLGKPTAECNSPCLPRVRPCSSFLSASSPSILTKPCISNRSCSVPRMVNSGAHLLTSYGSSLMPVEIPSTTPKAPCSNAAAGILHIPVVTNHLVRLVTAANKTPHPVAQVSLRAKTRRFPGPAGILPHQPDGKNLEEILIATTQTPTHGALAKLRTEEMPTSQQPMEEEFERGPWVTMKSELGLDERDPSCFLRAYSVVMVLRKAALKQIPKNKVPNMAVMIKSLMRTNVDTGAVFKDPTGEMQGTIHRLLLEEKESELKAGSVLLLTQVGVFSPSLRNHYLNVTPSNLVKIYSPGHSSGKPPQLYQENRERKGTVLPQTVSEFHQNPPTNAFTAVATTYYRCGEGHVDENCCQHISASDKGSPLTPVPRIRRMGKSVLNVPYPKAERADLDDLDQLLGELPDDFFSNLDEQSSL